MSYLILARKYRPQFFDQVIGQDAVITTLKNAITLNRLHQAYLFCGARGVGKTSLARIFAKSINCTAGPTLTPCQTCEACIGITQTNSLNVLEIDGASHTSVDNIRELREAAKYLPSSGKYKIYIIDEVHMLSTSAFNALLKILEEPPPHLIFIFATTEPHKIPITILSRCQRFDFRRISVPTLKGHLKNILSQENLSLDEESLTLIAGCADGSLRDALSLLDQILSFCGNETNPQKIREMLGLTDRALICGIVSALTEKNTTQCLQSIAQVFEKGFDLKIFAEGVLEFLRHIILIKEGGAAFVDLSPGEKELAETLSKKYPTIRFVHLFQILLKGLEELSRSEYPKMVLEITVIKMIQSEDFLSVSEILQRLKNQTSNPQPAKTSSPTLLPLIPTLSSPSGNEEIQSWKRFTQVVLTKKPQVGSFLERARLIEFNPPTIIIGFEAGSVYLEMIKDKMAVINEMALEYFKSDMVIKIKPQSPEHTINPTALEMREADEQKEMGAIRKKAVESSAIQMTQNVLGAKITEINRIKS